MDPKQVEEMILQNGREYVEQLRRQSHMVNGLGVHLTGVFIVEKLSANIVELRETLETVRKQRPTREGVSFPRTSEAQFGTAVHVPTGRVVHPTPAELREYEERRFEQELRQYDALLKHIADRIEWFQFLVTHLVQDVVYLLSPHECRQVYAGGRIDDLNSVYGGPLQVPTTQPY